MMKSKRSTATLNRIIGIDPGYGRVGIAVLEEKNKKTKLIYSECFETEIAKEHQDRLSLLVAKVGEVIEEFKPNKMALETLLFSKNVKTAMKVAEARGAILAEAGRRDIQVFQYNPNKIKVCVTGYGKADKKQITFMVEKLAKPEHKVKYDDEYDAIAVALTCAVMS